MLCSYLLYVGPFELELKQTLAELGILYGD